MDYFVPDYGKIFPDLILLLDDNCMDRMEILFRIAEEFTKLQACAYAPLDFDALVYNTIEQMTKMQSSRDFSSKELFKLMKLIFEIPLVVCFEENDQKWNPFDAAMTMAFHEWLSQCHQIRREGSLTAHAPYSQQLELLISRLYDLNEHAKYLPRSKDGRTDFFFFIDGYPRKVSV